MSDLFPTYRVPVLAYVDSAAGMVPCRVESVESDGTVTVTVTADRPAWHRGETVTLNPTHVVPRCHVRHRRHGTFIVGFWSYTNDPNAVTYQNLRTRTVTR